MLWFKHDSNAHSDAKLKKVLIRYGSSGYAMYWYCLECIVADVSSKNLTYQLEHDAEILAHDLKIDSKLVEEIMLYMVNIGLFEESAGIITCMKLAKRLDSSMTSNKEMRAIITSNRANSHDGVMMASGTVMQEENRIDKNRTEENRKEQLPYVDVQQAEASTRGGNKRQKAIPYKQIQELYNKNFGFETWARSSSVLTDKTKKQIAKVNPHMATLDDWAGYFGFCSRDRWINGTTRDSDWKPDIDYLTREKTHAKMADTLGDNS